MEEIEHVPTNMTSIHVIACIGENQPINNITIARKMNLSKANITKINTKLIKENLITRFQSADNKRRYIINLLRQDNHFVNYIRKFMTRKKMNFISSLIHFLKLNKTQY